MNSAPEEGFERIALFAKHKLGKLEATHAARLLPNGCWTSKLGPCEDIEHHVLLDVECPECGFVFCILKRYAPPRVKYVISLKSTMNRDLCLIRLSCAAAVHTQSAFICGSIILCSLFSAHASSSTRKRRETPMRRLQEREACSQPLHNFRGNAGVPAPRLRLWLPAFRKDDEDYPSTSPGNGTLPKPAMIAVTSSIAASAAAASVPLATIATPLPLGR